MFEVCQPDDPIHAVGGAHGVGDVEPVDPQHALATPCELVEGGASHATDADDDGVVDPFHRATACRGGLTALTPKTGARPLGTDVGTVNSVGSSAVPGSVRDFKNSTSAIT